MAMSLALSLAMPLAIFGGLPSGFLQPWWCLIKSCGFSLIFGRWMGFLSGLSFFSEVWSCFHSLVHFDSSSRLRSFILVADFKRSSFRLTTDLVAIALQCCLGGSPYGFHVIHIQNSTFSFTMASKHVGLLIYSLKSFSSKDFSVIFHLWRDREQIAATNILFGVRSVRMNGLWCSPRRTRPICLVLLWVSLLGLVLLLQLQSNLVLPLFQLIRFTPD